MLLKKTLNHPTTVWRPFPWTAKVASISQLDDMQVYKRRLGRLPPLWFFLGTPVGTGASTQIACDYDKGFHTSTRWERRDQG